MNLTSLVHQLYSRLVRVEDRQLRSKVEVGDPFGELGDTQWAW